jgi:hypothetical protein
MDRVLKGNSVRHYPTSRQNKVTSYLGITHLTTNETMNFVMYAFQGVARAAAIASGVVTERRPSMNTRHKIVSL